MQHSRTVGLIYATLATFFITAAHFMAQVHIARTKDRFSLELLFIRCVAQVVFLGPIMIIKRAPLWYGWKKKWYYLGLSVSMYIQYGLLYQFLQMLPLGDALAITGTAPFFMAMFSVFLLREQIKYMEITAGAVALVGVLLIARPKAIFGKYGTKSKVPHMNIKSKDYETTYLIGCAFATLFSIMRAFYLVIGRKWKKMLEDEDLEPNTAATVMYPSIFGTVVTFVIMLWTNHSFALNKSAWPVFALFSVGIFSSAGLLFLLMAVRTQSATVVGIIRNFEVVWAFLMDYAAYGDIPALWNGGGSFLIFSSAYIALLEDKCCWRRQVGEQGTVLNKDHGSVNETIEQME